MRLPRLPWQFVGGGILALIISMIVWIAIIAAIFGLIWLVVFWLGVAEDDMTGALVSQVSQFPKLGRL